MELQIIFVLFLCSIFGVNADYYISRFSCERGGVFSPSGIDQKCEGSQVALTKAQREVECIMFCMSKTGCSAVNMKLITSWQYECQLVKKNCSPTATKGWRYYIPNGDYLESQEIIFQDKKSLSPPIELQLNAKIYIPFDRIICGEEIPYAKGQDTMEKRSMKSRSAKVVKDSTSGRNVVTSDQKLFLGRFANHSINEPFQANLTVAYWFKCSDPFDARASKDYLSSGGYRQSGLYMSLSSGSILYVIVASKTGMWRFEGQFRLDKRCSQWIHVAMSFSDQASELHLYINGTLARSYTSRIVAEIRDEGQMLSMMILRGYGGFAYWDRILSLEEVKSAYQGFP